MSTERNIEIVKRYFGAVANGDLPAIGQALSDEIVWHQPGQGQLSGSYRGKEAVFKLLGEFMTRSAGTFRIDSVGALMGQGDLVAASIHFRAENAESSMSMTGIDLLRLDGEKICEVWLFSEDQRAEDDFWGRM